MHHYCPECGLNFKPETGFYFGATYVSYGLGVGIAITIVAILSIWIPFFENFEIFALAIIGTITLVSPLIFRLSRHGWLKIFNGYDKDAIAKHKAPQNEVA